MTLNEQWKLLAGVRYDEQKKDGEGENSYAVSPKFGVIYSPMANGSTLIIQKLYTTGFSEVQKM